jgi:hypothetical protein
MSDIAERWVRWWCEAWHFAHPSWRQTSPMLEAARCCKNSRHAVLTQSLGILATQPPPPHEGLLQWLALDETQQLRALTLAERICSAKLPRADDGHHAHADAGWCRSLGKALRPGLWLTAGVQDPRLLLGAWAGPTCWERLRLQWELGTLGEIPQDLPANRVAALWTAILWRVTHAESHRAD